MIDSEANNDTNQSLDVALKVELKSVGQAIRRNAAAKPEAMAIVSSGYQPMSYRQLAAQFDAFAAALHSAGLGRASRVAIGLKDARRRRWRSSRSAARLSPSRSIRT